MKRHRLVHVPASTANLGPGYDVLAAALSLELTLEVE
jgi:homoserine kinase